MKISSVQFSITNDVKRGQTLKAKYEAKAKPTR